MDNKLEYIICAAIKRNTPRQSASQLNNNDINNIEIGYRHCDIFWRFGEEVSRNPKDQGFYTSKGRFVDRKTAMEIAYKAHQVPWSIAISNPNDCKEIPIYDLVDDGKAYVCTGFKINGKPKWNDLFSEDLY